MTRAVGWICAEGHLGVVVHSIAVRIRRAIGVGPAQSKALYVVCQSDRGVGGDRESLGGAPSIVRIGHRRRDRVAASVGRWCRRRAVACVAISAVAVVKSGGDTRSGGGECFLSPAVNKVGRAGEGDVAGVKRHRIGDRESLGGAPSVVRIGHRCRDRVAASVGRWCRRRAVACAADSAVAVVKSGGDARGGGGECFLSPAVNKVGRAGEGDVAGVERHRIGRDAYRAGNWIVIHRIGGCEGDRVIRGAGTWSRVRGVERKNARHARRATAQAGGSEGLAEGNRRGGRDAGDRRRRFGDGEIEALRARVIRIIDGSHDGVAARIGWGHSARAVARPCAARVGVGEIRDTRSRGGVVL